MAIETPEYKSLIEDLMKRKQQEIAAATAQAQGEAQRRGLVGQTGTSDIEMALRGARTAPIEQAYTGNIAQMLTNLADTEAARKYGTSEREAAQTYGTGERTATQNWQTNQAAAERDWQNAMDLRSRGWAESDIKKARKDWWKEPLGGLAGTIGGVYAGSKLANVL